MSLLKLATARPEQMGKMDNPLDDGTQDIPVHDGRPLLLFSGTRRAVCVPLFLHCIHQISAVL